MGYTWDFGVIWENREAFRDGLLISCALTALVVLGGTAFGTVLGICRTARTRAVRLPALCYVELFRAIPILVLLVWIYYCLPIFLGIKLSGFATAVLALSLNASAYLSEIVRAGIESIDRGQSEAARAVGMSRLRTMRRIVLPQAMRRMIPPLMSQYIYLFKLSSLASVIAVYELLHAGNNVITNTFRPLEVYTSIAAIYMVIVLPLTFLSRQLEALVQVGGEPRRRGLWRRLSGSRLAELEQA